MLTNYFREKTWATHTSTESILFSYCKILSTLIQHVVHSRKRLYLKVEASIKIYLLTASTNNINNLQCSNDSKTISKSERMKFLLKSRKPVNLKPQIPRKGRWVPCLDAAYTVVGTNYIKTRLFGWKSRPFSYH